MTSEEDPSKSSGSPQHPAPQQPGKPETNASLGLAIVLALALLIGMAYMWQKFSAAETLPQSALFFGQFHPVIVHFPVALLLVVFIMEVLSIFKPLRGLQDNTRFLLWLATLGASGAIVAGYMLMSGGEYSGERVINHMWAGIGVAAGCLAALMLKSGTGQSLLYHFVLTLTVLTLLVAGHLGGSITHQADYLTRYMPENWAIKRYLEIEGGLQMLWGGQAVDDQAEAAEGTGSTIYQDYIYPIFDDKCVDCHNNDKSKGKLNMEEWAAFSQREEGLDPAFVAGDPGASLLVERIHLPLDDDDHMPPEDKTQLGEDEIRVIEWWIAQGASHDMTMEEASIDPEIEAILEGMEPPDPAILIAEKEKQEKLKAEEAKKLAARELALAEIEEAGFALRPISAEDPGLQFNAVNVVDAFGDETLALFAPVAGEIVELDLARTQITDASAGLLGSMENLAKLHLENTAITDETLSQLDGLDRLEYLNIYGTDVTDSGLEQLVGLDSLRSVYVWKTGVTKAAGKALEESVDGLEVNIGWSEQEVEAAISETETETERDPGEKKETTKAAPPSKPKPKTAEKKAGPGVETDEQREPGAEKKRAEKPKPKPKPKADAKEKVRPAAKSPPQAPEKEAAQPAKPGGKAKPKAGKDKQAESTPEV